MHLLTILATEGFLETELQGHGLGPVEGFLAGGVLEVTCSKRNALLPRAALFLYPVFTGMSMRSRSRQTLLHQCPLYIAGDL